MNALYVVYCYHNRNNNFLFLDCIPLKGGERFQIKNKDNNRDTIPSLESNSFLLVAHIFKLKKYILDQMIRTCK